MGLFGAGAIALRGTLWRAILFVRPGAIHLERLDARLPDALLRSATELMRLGFRPLGAHLEAPPLGRSARVFDFVHEGARTFASLISARPVPRVFFFTPVEPDGFVLTSNYPRGASAKPGYLSGSLENVPLERLFAAHRRRCEGMSTRGGLSLDDRIAAAREWYAGRGRSEVRAQHALGFLWSVGIVLMMAAVLWGRAGG